MNPTDASRKRRTPHAEDLKQALQAYTSGSHLVIQDAFVSTKHLWYAPEQWLAPAHNTHALTPPRSFSITRNAPMGSVQPGRSGNGSRRLGSFR